MKFKVGEIAILTCEFTSDGRCDATWPAGTEVEVLARGPWQAGEHVYGATDDCTERAEYLVGRDGLEAFCDEIHLRKRPAPGIPLETLRIFSEPQGNPDRVGETA